MSRRHGRATIPFGKHKGKEVRELPVTYLCWLGSSEIIVSPQWDWLRESVDAELRHCGLPETDNPHDLAEIGALLRAKGLLLRELRELKGNGNHPDQQRSNRTRIPRSSRLRGVQSALSEGN